MKKLIFLIYTIFLISGTTYSQNNFLDLIQNKMDNYSIHNSPEKVYIHTDKSAYLIDEDIWFTGYMVDGITHQKSEKSRVLHVELLNPKDSIVDQKTLFVENINVAGDFKIKKDWIPGKYILRAYSNYMKNDSFNSFFQKEIPIYKNTNDVPTEIKKAAADLKSNITKTYATPEISFYPEGGYLVSGIQSKVTFKVNNISNFKGTLNDQEGNVISDIKEIDRGLGAFALTPEVDKKYHVSTMVNGEKITYPLPVPLSKGYVLNITNTRKNIIVSLNSNTENGLQNTYLIAHQRGVLLYNIYEEKNTPTNTYKIPTSSLNSGVISFTLFNNDGNPVAERVAFVNDTSNNLELSINSNTDFYSTRQKISLDLSLKNKSGLNEYSFLSLSVKNSEASAYNKYANNIKTYLLLNSELRGEIKEPNYYFEKENDPKRNYLLDLVMMSNGWKRFTWQEILSKEEKKQTHEIEEGIYVTGTTYKYKKLDTPLQSVVRLSFFGKFIAQTPAQATDANGRFRFGPDIYPGSISATVEARQEDFLDISTRSKKVSIVLDDPRPIPVLNKQNTFNFNINQKQEENFVKATNYLQQIKFENDKKIERLAAIELRVKKLSNLEKRKKEMTKRTVYGSPDRSANRIDMKNLDYTPGSINEVLETNPTISLNNEGSGYLWNRNQSDVLIFLDNREIDYGFLSGISCNEISFIDIVTGPSTALLANTDKAIIVLYSDKNKKFVIDDTVKIKPGIVNFTGKGFYIARKFSSPTPTSLYETDTKDVRTTLHWEPLLRTTDKSNAKVSFYTGDVQSEYIIEVEGVSISGKPIHAIKTFKIE